MNNSKSGVIAFFATTVLFALCIGSLNVAAGLSAVTASLVVNALILGAMISVGAVFLTTVLFRRSVNDTICYGASGGLAALISYLVLNLTMGNALDLIGLVFVLVLGLLPALLGSVTARSLK